jgi:predicted transposase/invertase (TIGR01784 family)
MLTSPALLQQLNFFLEFSEKNMLLCPQEQLMELAKFLDPKNDFAFKQIFGTEKNKDILIHFLNDMICFPGGARVTSVSFPPTVSDPDTVAKKQSVVDVLCVDEHGNQYIVEMQVANTKGFEKRAQYYAAKAYVNQMKEGDKYHNLKEIIFLAITNFVMFSDIEAYKSDHVILDLGTKTHQLKDFYFCFLELPKFNKEIHELTTIVEKWAYFFKHASHTAPQEVEEIVGADAILQKAYTALNQFYWSSLEVDAYEAERKRQLDERAVYEQKVSEGEAIGFVKGKAEGFVEGKEKGKAEALEDVVKRLLSQGVSLETIQVATKLSPEDIQTLLSPQ